MIGIATKKYFEEVIIHSKVEWTDLDCRNPGYFRGGSIDKLNTFDYIVVGGGGLILPDSAPNNISCWQWVISKNDIERINIPIQCISIGYNLFFGQTLEMTSRSSNQITTGRIPVFKENMKTLIEKSSHYSIRHSADRDKLLEVLEHYQADKIKMELCPTTWYAKTYWKPLRCEVKENQQLAIEVKDDREWRRQAKISKGEYQNHLFEFLKWYQDAVDSKIAYMCHDGSRNFFSYATQRGLKMLFLDNSVANEERIRKNYEKVHTLLCMAGHSEMIAWALGIRVIPLVTHPKTAAFAEDVGIREVIPFDADVDICNELQSFF